MEDPNKVPTPEGNEPKEPETPQTPTPEEPKEPKPQPVPMEPGVDYKVKFAESTREAQILAQQNKELKQKLDSLTTNNDPTEEELRQRYPDWEYLNDETKRAYREISIANKKAEAANKLVLDMYEERKWNEDLSRVLDFFPKLKGREAEFKQFAYKPTHKGVSLDVLAKSFLFDMNEKPQAPATPPSPGLERGSGGREAPATPKMSPEDIAVIRKNDPVRYSEMLKSGQIKAEDLL